MVKDDPQHQQPHQSQDWLPWERMREQRWHTPIINRIGPTSRNSPGSVYSSGNWREHDNPRPAHRLEPALMLKHREERIRARRLIRQRFFSGGLRVVRGERH